MFFEKLILIDSKSLAFDVYTKAEQKYWKSIIRNPPNHVNFIPLHGCVYTSVFLSWNYTIVAWKFMSCSFPKLFDLKVETSHNETFVQKNKPCQQNKTKTLVDKCQQKNMACISIWNYSFS